MTSTGVEARTAAPARVELELIAIMLASDCSRNNGRRENDKDLAHLSLLSETLVQPGVRVPPPQALLGQRSGNKTVNCDQLFLAPKDFFESCSKGPVERCNS